MPSRVAASSALTVLARGNVGSKGAMPSRSRRSRTRRVVQACPSAGLHRIRLIVTATSRSGHWPPSLQMTYWAGVAIRRVSPSADARDAQLSVTTAVPMDRHNRLVGRVIAVEHDFPDQDVGNPLLGSGVGARSVPGGRQVAGERYQRCSINLRAPRDSGIVPGDAVLEIGDTLQRCVPAGFEFARHQTLSRVDDLVATGGQGGFITCFLKLPAERLSDLIVGLHRLIGSLDRGFDGVFRDGFDDLRSNSTINPDTADASAQPSAADVTVVAAALVAMSMAGLRAIAHPHRAAATGAAHKARQQCPTAAR